MIRSAPRADVPAAAAPVLERIRAEHRALELSIGAMQALVGRWRSPAEPLDLAPFDALLAYLEDAPERLHHPQEDRVLFPAVARRSAQARALVAALEADHRRSARVLAGTRAALERFRRAGPPALEALATAVEELAEFYWWHLHREEEELLPLALTALTDADWRRIAASY